MQFGNCLWHNFSYISIQLEVQNKQSYFHGTPRTRYTEMPNAKSTKVQLAQNLKKSPQLYHLITDQNVVIYT